MPTWVSELANWFLTTGESDFQCFYASNLRNNLFDGYLTLGGFLLAAYTFVVIHMKREVFDSAQYKEVFERHKAQNEKLRLYGPLKLMSVRLFRAVLVTLAVAAMQLSVGLVPANAAVLLCEVAAVVAACYVFRGVSIVGSNMAAWFRSMETADPPNVTPP